MVSGDWGIVNRLVGDWGMGIGEWDDHTIGFVELAGSIPCSLFTIHYMLCSVRRMISSWSSGPRSLK